MIDRQTNSKECYTEIQADRHRITRGLDRQMRDLLVLYRLTPKSVRQTNRGTHRQTSQTDRQVRQKDTYIHTDSKTQRQTDTEKETDMKTDTATDKENDKDRHTRVLDRLTDK